MHFFLKMLPETPPWIIKLKKWSNVVVFRLFQLRIPEETVKQVDGCVSKQFLFVANNDGIINIILTTSSSNLSFVDNASPQQRKTPNLASRR